MRLSRLTTREQLALIRLRISRRTLVGRARALRITPAQLDRIVMGRHARAETIARVRRRLAALERAGLARWIARRPTN
jgi:hypothetical protein